MCVLLPCIRSVDDVETLVSFYGILPFFAGHIPGFSIEESCPDMWEMPDGGPWEWKGPIIRKKNCVYGKLVLKKAAFVRLDLLPELANLRRDGYDMDARFEDGLAPYCDWKLYETLQKSGPIRSDELRRLVGYGRNGLKGYDTHMARLQMETYIVVEDFEHRIDRNGRAYGWGIARLAAPEMMFGDGFVRSAYARPPRESAERVFTQMKNALKGVPEKDIWKLIGTKEEK